LGIGNVLHNDLEWLGIKPVDGGIKVNRDTLQTEIQGVFAGGDARKGLRLAVRSMADGKKAGAGILQYLKGEPVTGVERLFNSRMGKLRREIMEYKDSDHKEKVLRLNLIMDKQGSGFSESRYCLHCDCGRKKSASCVYMQMNMGQQGENTGESGGTLSALMNTVKY
jgi:formate dehydrogenase major subunit